MTKRRGPDHHETVGCKASSVPTTPAGPEPIMERAPSKKWRPAPPPHPYGIECRWLNDSGQFGRWMTWKRYRTTRERDEALMIIKRKYAPGARFAGMCDFRKVGP